jgi:crossover junction endodeoxyribonuclease RuvC
VISQPSNTPSLHFRVLGVDPAATGPTGYGIIESDGRRCTLLHYGALRIAPKRHAESLGAALQDVHTRICQLIAEFSPQALALEGIFSALNVRTALRLAEVRGVILLAAAQNNLAVHSYSPREVKASVAGHGNADKRQMQIMVRALLQMAEIPEPSDAADALAVALCHLQAEQTRARFALPVPLLASKPPAKRRNIPGSAVEAHITTTALTRAVSATPRPAPRIVIHR